ncbi:hypothetical protein UFOVP257_4 [uncultured Caudovirales phage]|uniref:Uncharacterized protein n=1 Tax=uncultured Caudovirales phage TaxID=2100421 RepID=A0A6J5LF72_9CAUD|nr:hypothetical protein UFOVP257_4 [uncultured Caudovirales phage]
MAVVKNLNTDYTITNKISPLANVTLATHTVFVQGNLIVGGNSTSVSKTDLAISDNIIILNKGEAGAGVTLNTAGLEIDRGSFANVRLIWNETYKKWSLTNDGITYANVSTSSGSGGTTVRDDSAPQLGGNLDVLARSIFSSNTAYVKFDDNIAMQTTSIVPTAQVGYAVMFAQNTNPGGSGIYVANNGSAKEELITKKQSVGYSIIFS